MVQLATENSDKFSTLVTQWRHLRGLSQEEVADAIGSSQRHVSFIENGRSRPSAETVERMAEALEMPPQDRDRLLNLLGYTGHFEGQTNPTTDLQPVHEAAARLLIAGASPHAASFDDERQRMKAMNRTMGLVMSRFANEPEVWDDGYISWPAVMFHPNGVRKALDNWDEVAAAYMQVLLRKRLRTPEVGERIINMVRRISDIPKDWLTLNDKYRGTTGMVMEYQSSGGPMRLAHMTLYVASPPTQPSIQLPELYVTMYLTADPQSYALLQQIYSMTTIEDVHERLRPLIVEEGPADSFYAALSSVQNPDA